MTFVALHADRGRVDATLNDLGCGWAWSEIHRRRPRVGLDVGRHRLARHHAVFERNLAGLAAYRPARYDCHVHVVEGVATARTGATSRWRERAGGCTVHPLPAGHYEIVRERYAAAVLDILDAGEAG